MDLLASLWSRVALKAEIWNIYEGINIPGAHLSLDYLRNDHRFRNTTSCPVSVDKWLNGLFLGSLKNPGDLFIVRVCQPWETTRNVLSLESVCEVG